LAGVCLNFSVCLLNMCTSTDLTALWFQHSQMKRRFHHPLFGQCDCGFYGHLCDFALKESKLKLFSAFCAHP
jgi:hypothetical protein